MLTDVINNFRADEKETIFIKTTKRENAYVAYVAEDNSVYLYLGFKDKGALKRGNDFSSSYY